MKSSKKRIKQSEKLRRNNMRRKSMIKTFTKRVLSFLSNKDIEQAKYYFNRVQSILDRFSQKNVIHRNKASRKKSRLSKKINQISKLL
ncbi:30S ribosomal protein S20 [Candidatus Riesia pediculicola]|uniref:Small ribosomal subunit protein bS20 n=1 Tax=Riesia pediculicola (strain USDA) TaxID=515618 RepID=D4G8X5_RIEPU|nr:30S ribosomal protein S20 [Candidatus Riesia pediculicola]ADD79706.1 ribosomal protein S20 [Candidatus Riesia pediculicola USDA]ARC53985.1 30S ribosomal protein S20 [Candidatus Riesia pediculicola]ARC54568.1 30S ribosomal protein S20 [Candidatus Riesia pediculicola]QOJ86611.1 30S ribosomal protein S20 [Candidatus Riesia pediculicola]